MAPMAERQKPARQPGARGTGGHSPAARCEGGHKAARDPGEAAVYSHSPCVHSAPLCSCVPVSPVPVRCSCALLYAYNCESKGCE